jgi:predicted transcriptional regulator
MRNDAFVREKPSKLLLALKTAEQTNTPNTIMGLARASGMSFVHASNFLAELEEGSLITSAKVGRNKRITLTPKGQDIAAALEILMAKLNQPAPADAPQPQTAQPSDKTPAAPVQEKAAVLQEFPQPPAQSKKDAEKEKEDKEEDEDKKS